MDSAEKYSVVKDYVLAERSRLGIQKLDPRHKAEPSGEAFNEFDLLLDVQLVTTPEGRGGWHELADADVLEGVYRRVVMRIAAKDSVRQTPN